MKTITTNTDVYEFRELPAEAQKRAINDVRNNEWYPGDYYTEFVIEEFLSDRKNEGWDLDDTDVHYSGFWSQGDGACFDGTLNIHSYIHFHNLQDKYPLVLKYEEEFSITGKIHKNHYGYHYSHERTRYFEIDSDWIDSAHGEEVITEGVPALEAEMNALEEDIEAERLDLSQKLYRALEEEYDYQMSDETITDHIISNDYEFTLDGKQY